MISIFIGPILAISITVFLLMIFKRNVKIHKYITNTVYVTLFLLFLTLIGFFFQEDFNEDCGCLVHATRDVFSIDYIFFSLVSLALISASLLVKRKYIKVVLLTIELIYWLIKLFVLKSGYEGGLGILVFKLYDFIGLTTRIWLINLLLDFKLREFFIPIIAGILITIKMFFFPCQENKIYKKYLEPYYNEKLFDKINGVWTGNLLDVDTLTYYRPFDSSNIYDLLTQHDTVTYRDTILWTIAKELSVIIHDSSLIFVDSVPEWEKNYKIFSTSPEYGYISYFPTRYGDFTGEMFFIDTMNNKRITINISENDTLTITKIFDNNRLVILDNKNSR